MNMHQFVFALLLVLAVLASASAFYVYGQRGIRGRPYYGGGGGGGRYFYEDIDDDYYQRYYYG